MMSKKLVRIGFMCTAVFVTVAMASAPAAATPKISWSQGTVAATIAKGGTYTATVTFTSAIDLTNATFKWSPSVGGVLAVDPTSIASVVASSANSLTFTVTIPSNTKKKNYNGSLWVSVGQRRYANPLALRFSVQK
ncbi:MAG: hypothetical protein HYX75_00675 [Acidobacteria bacterium]|nr:hypothetical protein [Acidobacteriota bacterium]